MFKQRITAGGFVLLVLLAGVTVRQSNAQSSLTIAATFNESLTDPRFGLTSSFEHEVTYETTLSNLELRLEVIEMVDAFDDIVLQVEYVNFTSVASLGPGFAPGTSAGPQTYGATAGPFPILTNITNASVTATIKVTVTLSSVHALSSDRDFSFRYTLFP